MMLWRLKRKLTQLGRRANPDEALKLEMRQFFQDKGYFAKPEVIPVTRHFSVFPFAAVALVVVLFVSVGTASFAYASGAVLPDSLLYPVKEKLESLEERLAASEQEKQEVLIRHQARRLEEARILMEQQKPLPMLHEALLFEIKRDEQLKAEGREVDPTLPLVKARLQVEAEVLLKEQFVQQNEAEKVSVPSSQTEEEQQRLLREAEAKRQEDLNRQAQEQERLRLEAIRLEQVRQALELQRQKERAQEEALKALEEQKRLESEALLKAEAERKAALDAQTQTSIEREKIDQ